MSKYDQKMRELNTKWVYSGREDRPKIEVKKKDIKEIEKEIGCALPENYVDFLLNYGGSSFRSGYVISLPLEYKMDISAVIVSVFFGHMPGYGYDLLDAWHTYKDEEDLRMPRSFLPIATDPGGNIFCLSLFGEDEGKVYFWECQLEEMPEPGEEPGYSNVTLLANSFDEFIDSLTLKPHR